MLLQADKLVSSTPTTKISLTPITQLLSSLPTHLRTLYLFTANDFLTFAIPTTLFAVFGTLSGPVLTTNSSPSILHIFSRIPASLLVVWSNLLIFDISNQRSPSAVEEDKINKPHRPLPSGRITTEASRRLLLWGIPFVLFLGWVLGCWQETLLLFTATWMYNDLQGCDEDWILRNFLIAVGYGLYSSAALRVMVGPEYGVKTEGFIWVGLVTIVMFVTQHICDIKDAEGDRSRGRQSAPIVLGDDMVRWSVAVPIMICSILCPAFFGLGFSSYVFTLAMGGLVAGRTLLFRDLKSDKLTWKLWALWTCSLFALPLVKDHAVLVEMWESVKGCVCPGGDCSSGLNLMAVSTVALAVEGRRLLQHGQFGGMGGEQGNGTMTVPRVVLEGVVA